MTERAEDQIFLCAPQVRRKHDGGVIFYEPSPFIRDSKQSEEGLELATATKWQIPPHLLKQAGGFFQS